MVDYGIVYNVLFWTVLLVGGHAGLGPPVLFVGAAGVGYGGLTIYDLVATAVSGQTLGKRLLGIRVVRSDTYDVPGWRRAAIRTFGLVPLGWVPHGGYSTIAVQAYTFTASRQGLHDLLAGTMVVNDQEWRRWAAPRTTSQNRVRRLCG